MVKEKRIAIILARGGSKRLPNKNILRIKNKPLVAWTIEAAINSGQFEKVLVSTDSIKISNISKKYNAEVPFLRNKAADDYSPSSLATYYALRQAEKFWGEKYDIVVQLMANCPLRSAQDIKTSIKAFKKSKAPSQISCFRYGWMNPWWAVKLNKKGIPSKIFPKLSKKRSQDYQKLYCPSGALWIAKRDNFITEKNFYMKGHRFQEINWISAIDIDDKEDLIMTKICLNLRNSKKQYNQLV
jgi:N-acylneuraminate cytidylyltransferase